MKKLTKFNLNDYVVFKPREKALKVYYEKRTQYIPKGLMYEGAGILQVNEHGFAKMQMHDFMNTFGEHMVNGMDPIVETTVFFEGEALKEFTATDWFNISGRGWVATLTLEEDVYSSEIFNTEVVIDNKIYFVTGIESFAKNRSHNTVNGALFSKGESVGLLIRGEK